MTDNPLSNYFRRPSIYITLPSGGKFYDGNLELNPTGELPIFPMTAIDEITYRTPDALFNGTATVEVIKSCAPGIKDPWQMPSVDLAAVLIAIRIASFGHEMDIESQCPKCQNARDYSIDLRTILDSLEKPNFDRPFEAGDLQVYFKPLNYAEMNENSKINFEEQRLTRSIEADPNVDDDKRLALLSEAFKKVSTFTLETLAKNIDRIETPDSTVTDQIYILDFLRNCDREIYKGIKAYVIKERSKADLKPLHIKCDNCEHEYEQPYTLDMSNFFE